MSLLEPIEPNLEPDLALVLPAPVRFPPPSAEPAAAAPIEAAPEWTVETVTGLAGFEALRGEWDELLSASSSGRLFLTWEWLYAFWRRLGAAHPGRELALVVVRRDGRLSAVAPLFSARSRRGLLPGETLQLLGTGIVGSDYLDLIVRAGEERTATRRLADHLEHIGAIVELGQLTGGGGAAAMLADALAQRGWGRLEAATHVCPYVDLAGHTWESYLASLGRSHRANVRRRLRKLEQAFEVRFESVRTEEERAEALELLVALHHDRWKDRGGSDAFSGPEVEDFHREVTRRALERGWLRLFVLRLDGRPAAALYGFRYGDRFLYYQSGFASDFADYSVGLVTMGLSIRAAIEEGVREYDLLHGEETYKFLWASRTRELSRIELFPPRLEARLRRALRSAVRGTKGLVRSCLLDRGGAR